MDILFACVLIIGAGVSVNAANNDNKPTTVQYIIANNLN